MHVVHHIVKILTHIMEGYENWVEVKAVQDSLKLAKSQIQEVLKPGKFPGGSKEDNIGVAYEFPDAKVGCVWACVCLYVYVSVSVYVCVWTQNTEFQGYGGTTTTAETARKILQSRILRKRLVDLCPPEYQEAMSKILLNALTLLSIMSCDKLINIEKLGELVVLIIFNSEMTILDYLRQLS